MDQEIKTNTTEQQTKGKKRRVKKFFRSFVDVKRWLATEQIASSGRVLIDGAKSLLLPRKSEIVETFDEAIIRLNLSEENIGERAKQFFNMACVYFGITIILCVYAVYLFTKGSVGAGLICVSLSTLSASYALREHFWYMQMMKRKLGCNFTDWAKFFADQLSKKLKKGTKK